MTEVTARAISTVGIWIATAVILTFGVFRVNWNGDAAMFFMFMIVIIICFAASVSTAAAWGWKPGKRGADAQPEKREVTI